MNKGLSGLERRRWVISDRIVIFGVPLIMYCEYLFRKLFLTQFVQRIKLAAEDLIFTKTCAG